VFFCQGVTCQMSPLSQRKAIALGYRNTKVYHQGIPEWETRDYLVTQPQFVKEAYVDKGIPVVLLDARRAEFAQTAHLAGAVAMTPQQVAAGAKKAFPDPKLKAPIIVYDGVGGEAAVAAARALVRAGQSNVQVMQGGLIAWQSAGYGVETGKAAATQVVYVPKPRPGSVPAEEFTKLATNTPADVLILDVRNQDEANNGMIKGALLIPEEDLSGRMGEVPKDKRIIAHCATGIRAEMAYHKLKDAGYKAGFLNADIEIAKDGSFKLSPKL
jgi:rhodanese-related sulfurtransferase